MRTPNRLWPLSFLTGLVATPAFAQVPTSQDVMRVNPVVQRERDTTRMSILQDELAAETRELETAQKELRDSPALRLPADRVQEITGRITLHRQNLSALEREIALVERPVINASRSPERRQPDDWLIPGQRLAAAGPRPDVPVRRRLPLAEPEVKLPEWVIRGGYTGVGP